MELDEMDESVDTGKFEMLLEFQKSLYSEELERTLHADEKADRYLTILVAVVGASAFALSRIELAELWTSWNWRDGTIVVGLMLFYLSSFGALFLCLHSLGIRKYPAIPLGTEVPEFFMQHEYGQVLWSLSEQYREAAIATRDENATKYLSLRWVSRLLVVAVFVGIMIGTVVFSKGIY